MDITFEFSCVFVDSEWRLLFGFAHFLAHLWSFVYMKVLSEILLIKHVVIGKVKFFITFICHLPLLFSLPLHVGQIFLSYI